MIPKDCTVKELGGLCDTLAGPGQQPTPSSTASAEPSDATARAAQRAVAELKLPSPEIHMNPDASAAQVVGVPTWLWIDRSLWGPVSKTVQVPGAAVTATATPQRVFWSMGDAGSVVCAGPGTPYSPVYPADGSSPDCGYTYWQSSAGRPGEAFTVTATVVWTVVWHGSGESGTVPGLVSKAQVPVKVSEVQSVVVSGSGSI